LLLPMITFQFKALLFLARGFFHLGRKPLLPIKTVSIMISWKLYRCSSFPCAVGTFLTLHPVLRQNMR
jgi:hypothetical protein